MPVRSNIVFTMFVSRISDALGFGNAEVSVLSMPVRSNIVFTMFVTCISDAAGPEVVQPGVRPSARCAARTCTCMCE